MNVRHGERRARFSIAHEIGHFLLERHALSEDSGFRCRKADMRERRTATQHQRQEREANQFAIGLLAPPYLVDPFLARDPDLRVALQMTKRLDIKPRGSAVVLCRALRPTARRRLVSSRIDPVRGAGQALPLDLTLQREPDRGDTAASRAIRSGRTGVSRISETPALAWLDRAEIGLFEQTRVGRDGHAVTLLWATMPDADEVDDGGLEELWMPGFSER